MWKRRQGVSIQQRRGVSPPFGSGISRMSDGDRDIQPEIAEHGSFHTLFKTCHIRLSALSGSVVDAFDDRQAVGCRGIRRIR